MGSSTPMNVVTNEAFVLGVTIPRDVAMSHPTPWKATLYHTIIGHGLSLNTMKCYAMLLSFTVCHPTSRKATPCHTQSRCPSKYHVMQRHATLTLRSTVYTLCKAGLSYAFSLSLSRYAFSLSMSLFPIQHHEMQRHTTLSHCFPTNTIKCNATQCYMYTFSHSLPPNTMSFNFLPHSVTVFHPTPWNALPCYIQSQFVTQHHDLQLYATLSPGLPLNTMKGNALPH